MSITRVIWLAVQPTPYNQHLLVNMKRSLGLPVSVCYSKKVVSGMPWKERYKDREDRFLSRILGIDWNVTGQALFHRQTFFIVAGWDEPTKLLVMVIRRLRRGPFALWTDTVRMPGAGLKDRLKVRFVRWLTRGATAVLSTGEVGVAAFRQAGYAESFVPVINFPFYVQLPLTWKRERAGTENIRFLSAGRLVARKGVDLAIEALSLCVSAGLGNVSLLIAGTGPEESALRQLCVARLVSEKVQFLGWLEAAQMEDLRMRADVLVHVVPQPDPFPVTVLEAMAAGMPVIASALAGSAIERVQPGESGFIVDSHNVQELANAMMEFIRTPHLVSLMGKCAREMAQQWPVERGVETIRTLITGFNK